MEIKITNDTGKYIFGTDKIYRKYRITKEINIDMEALKEQIIFGDKYFDKTIRCLKVTNWNDIKYKARPKFIDYKYV